MQMSLLSCKNDNLYYSGRKIFERCENSLQITEYITESFVI